MRHPLAIALRRSWRWLHDDDRAFVTLLHPTGLHVCIPVAPLITHAQDAELWTEIADGIKDRIRDGVTGRLVFAEVVQED